MEYTTAPILDPNITKIQGLSLEVFGSKLRELIQLYNFGGLSFTVWQTTREPSVKSNSWFSNCCSLAVTMQATLQCTEPQTCTDQVKNHIALWKYYTTYIPAKVLGNSVHLAVTKTCAEYCQALVGLEGRFLNIRFSQLSTEQPRVKNRLISPESCWWCI